MKLYLSIKLAWWVRPALFFTVLAELVSKRITDWILERGIKVEVKK
jgi:hypothetical protein